MSAADQEWSVRVVGASSEARLRRQQLPGLFSTTFYHHHDDDDDDDDEGEEEDADDAAAEDDADDMDLVICSLI